jgi:hypothetical protein
MTDKHEYRGIVKRLKALQARIAWIDSVRGIVITVGAAILLCALLIGITMVTWPDSLVRLLIDAGLILTMTSVLYFAAFRFLVKRRGFLHIARLLEKHYGRFQTRLIAALELYDKAKENRENYSLDLIEKTIEEAGEVITEIDTNVILDKKPLLSASIRTGFLVVAAAIGFLINPSIVRQTWQLYSNPATDISKPPEFSLTIEPSGGEFFRNKDLTIRAIPQGKVPRSVNMHFRFDGGEWASEPMTRADGDSLPLFTHTFRNIKRSVDVYAKSGRIESDPAHIEIVDAPRLVDIYLTIDYPDYSHLPDAVGDPNDGNVIALKGSIIHLEATANKPLSSAYQLYDDSSRANLRIDGRQISGGFTLKENSRYTIMMSDLAGRNNPEPIWYDIQVLDDYPPSIEILFPAVDVDLSERMILPLEVSIGDDYGFDRLHLVWWMFSEGSQSEPAKERLPISDPRALEQVVRYQWDFNRISPLPGDLIYYYCEISDNDIISGPKWTKSRTYLARLPSLDEILAEVQGSQEQQIVDLEEVMKHQEDLQEQINEIAREMLKATEVDWENQQAAKNVLEKQRDLAERLQNLADDMQENLEELEYNSLIGEEIVEKLQELQTLMEEIATPELKEAMKKLQEALENMDPEELRQALEEFQMTSEELLENLDRSLSLMKQLAIEQKMDLLVELAERILENQNQINENVDAAGDSSALADQSQACKNNSGQFDSLKEQFEQLKQMDADMQLVPQPEKTDAEKQINNPQIPQDLAGMMMSLCSGSKGMCKNRGKSLTGNLEQVLEALRRARDAMQQEMLADITRKLQRASEDLLYLSRRQEGLLDSTRDLEESAVNLRRLVGLESQIQAAASRIAELISDVSKQTVFVNITLLRHMGQILSDLSDASGHLDNRSAQKAIRSEISAMASMNMVVFMLMQAQQACQSSCSGSGMSEMMKQMGQISQQQTGINQQTMMLLPKPGMPLTLSQQQSLRRLGAQQEMLRRQLGELDEEFGKRGDMLGRLDALGEEMKKVSEDLAESKVDRRTIDRQDRILSRLLDAQRSVHRREFSRKRKAEQGMDMARKSPVLPDDYSNRSGWLSNIIERALQEGYPRKYDRLIKAYFRSLQNEGAALEQ